MIPLTKPYTGKEEVEAVKEVLQSGWLTEGPRARRLEERIAEYVGAAHAVACSNCTVALEMSLRAAGVRAGDEVIVPNLTHPATANAVAILGAEVVLVDVDLKTYNVDWEKARDAVTEKTKAIIPVSLFGNPLGVGRDELDICTIEDAACSLGASYDGIMTGNMCDITCFSFHPRKIATCGEGGLITTNIAEAARFCNEYKKFGTRNGVFTGQGTNYKLSDILAAIALVQLGRLPDMINRRRELAERYTRKLRKVEGVVTPWVDPKAEHTFQTYTIRVANRDAVLNGLREKGIEAQIGTYALHLQRSYEGVRRAGGLENSERLYRELLALPIFTEMSRDQQDTVIEAVKGIVEP